MSELPGVGKNSTAGVLGGRVDVPAPGNCLQGSAVPSLVVSSGVKEDVFTFQWKIENFAIIREHDYLIKNQQIKVVTDEGVTWSVCLVLGKKGAEAYIGVMRRLLDLPIEGKNDEKVLSSMDLEVMNRSFIQATKVQMKAGCKMFGWNYVIPKNSDVERLQLVDGALVINITLKTFIKLRVSTHKRKSEDEFEYKSAKQMRKDFGSLLNESDDDEEGGDGVVPDEDDGSPLKSTFSDVKIFSKDGKEFRAHKAILSARSPVFKAMFQSNLVEAQTGVVKIDDVTGNIFKIVLNFMYGGVLSKEWNQVDIIDEFAYAVEKYQLVNLREFLDDTLGEICTDQTVVRFLEVAERYSLQKAEMQCMKYIKDHGLSRAKSFSDLVKLFNVD